MNGKLQVLLVAIAVVGAQAGFAPLAPPPPGLFDEGFTGLGKKIGGGIGGVPDTFLGLGKHFAETLLGKPAAGGKGEAAAPSKPVFKRSIAEIYPGVAPPPGLFDEGFTGLGKKIGAGIGGVPDTFLGLGKTVAQTLLGKPAAGGKGEAVAPSKPVFKRSIAEIFPAVAPPPGLFDEGFTGIGKKIGAGIGGVPDTFLGLGKTVAQTLLGKPAAGGKGEAAAPKE